MSTNQPSNVEKLRTRLEKEITNESLVVLDAITGELSQRIRKMALKYQADFPEIPLGYTIVGLSDNLHRASYSDTKIKKEANEKIRKELIEKGISEERINDIVKQIDAEIENICGDILKNIENI